MVQPKNQWTKRKVFHDLCDAWLRSHPKQTKDDLANLMLMPDEKTLRQYYSGTQNPGRGRAKQMAKVLGCAASDLLDDSDESHPGIWDTVDIRVRAETESMFHQSKLIPPDKLPEFIEMLRKAHEIALTAFKIDVHKK